MVGEGSLRAVGIARVVPGTWAVWRQRQARTGVPQLKPEHLVGRVWRAESG